MKLRGILLLNKPLYLSSYDCIRKLKRLFPNTKLGHAGTLDPIAKGLLLILFNEATKIADYLSANDKEYIAQIRLGITTDTDDITGQIIKDNSYENIAQSQIEQTLKSFIGERNQIPPRFSAIKLKGRKGYELARNGIDFIPKSRKIIIKTIDLLKVDLPMIEIKTLVSKGTYIRALARDIGERLGCGATLQELSRTRIGRFALENSVEPDEIKQNNITELIYPINEALSDIPAIVVTELELQKLLKGQPITKIASSEQQVASDVVRVVDNQNRVLIMAKYRDNKIYPDRLIYADSQ